MPCVSFLLTRTADAPLPPRRLSPFGEKTAPRQRPCSQPCGRPYRGFCSSGTPTLYPLSCALPSLANLVATFQPSVPKAPGTALGRTILARSREAKPDFSVEETPAAISLRRARSSCFCEPKDLRVLAAMAASTSLI